MSSSPPDPAPSVDVVSGGAGQEGRFFYGEETEVEKRSRLVLLSIFDREARRPVNRMAEKWAEEAGDSPVLSVERLKRDWVVRKAAKPAHFEQKHERGVIKEFSGRSRLRLCHVVRNCNVDFRSMLTVTYPGEFESEGKIVKGHLHSLQKWLARRGIRGVWFLEFQRRGAPHFHFLLDFCLPDPLVLLHRRNGERSPTFRTNLDWQGKVSEAWYRIVGSGDERHLRAGVCWEVLESSEAALRYAAKHAAKPHQKEVPDNYQNVGRFWGKVGKVRIESKGHVVCEGREIVGFHGIDSISSSGRVRKYLWDAERKLEGELSGGGEGGERSEPDERSESPQVPRRRRQYLPI